MQDMPLHEYLRHHARTTPTKTAFVWYGYEMSYAQLDYLSDKCASMLHDLGVRRGEPVALFMQNCLQYVIAHFGIQKLGAIVSPCSPLFKQHELSYQLQDLEARVIIAAQDLLPVVSAAKEKTELKHIIAIRYSDFVPSQPAYRVPDEIVASMGPMPEGVIDLYRTLQDFSSELCTVDVALDDVALLAYTSGTTGRPKGAMLTFGNALFKAKGAVQVSGLTKDDIHLAIPPLYHISGMLFGINIPVLLGGTTVLHYRFNAYSTVESIEKYRPTYWKAIAPMLSAILDDPACSGFDLSSLRKCPATSFGIKTTPELAERWAQVAANAKVYEGGYGLTETHTFDSATPPEAIRWGSNGRLLPGVECKIINAQTQEELPTGEEGEILLRSPGSFKGYWKQAEKTAQTLIDGWVHTGDVGRLDSDGYLTLSGRIKELIKVSGYSVFPEDVEAILVLHPAVAQAAVIGVNDARKGQLVVAFIVLRPGFVLDAEALITWSRANMSAYKVPKFIEFRESLPMTASGKVQRNQLQLGI